MKSISNYLYLYSVYQLLLTATTTSLVLHQVFGLEISQPNTLHLFLKQLTTILEPLLKEPPELFRIIQLQPKTGP